MRWIEFAVYTTDMGIELVCGALAGIGIEQVSIEESRDRVEAYLREAAPCWDYADAAALAGKRGPCVKAYIADLPENGQLLTDARKAVHRLHEIAADEDIAPLQIEETPMDEEDWANNWKRYYKPMPIGERLLVCPSWEAEKLSNEDVAGRILLKLDPGMVFGTGAHDTTRMCLEALELCVREGDTVLDIGCGSGILSIAALLLGAKNAVCVDIDPVAETVVKENLYMNNLRENMADIHIGNILQDSGLQKALSGVYDIVVANIVADVVIGITGIVKKYMKPGACFLCSGIIEERCEEVKRAIEGAGLMVTKTFRSNVGEDSANGREETAWMAYLAKAGQEDA